MRLGERVQTPKGSGLIGRRGDLRVRSGVEIKTDERTPPALSCGEDGASAASLLGLLMLAALLEVP